MHVGMKSSFHDNATPLEGESVGKAILYTVDIGKVPLSEIPRYMYTTLDIPYIGYFKIASKIENKGLSMLPLEDF